MNSLQWRARWIGGILLFLVGLGGKVEGAMTMNASLSISERYNDNLFFTETDREGDFATVVIPALKLTHASRNLDLAAEYQGAAEFHTQHPETDRYDQRASLALGLPLLSRAVRGLEVRMTEAATYTAELSAFSFEDQSREIREGIQIPRTDTFQNQVRVSLSYPWSLRSSTFLSYTNLITRYKSPEFRDSTVHDTGLETRYQWSTTTQWIASYRAGVTDYAGAGSISTHRLALGFGHRISPTLSLNGSLGVALIEQEFARLIADISVSKNYPSGSLSLRYTRDVGTGSGLTSSVTLSQRAVARSTWTLGNDVLTYVQVAYGRNVSIPEKELNTSSYEAGMGVNLRLLDWLEGSLSYAYFNERSRGILGTDGTRNQVMLTLMASWPRARSVKGRID